jgi:type I restriction enzyme S subunit
MIKQVKVSDFAEVITGGTPSTTVNEYWDGGTIPWLNSGELNKKYIYNSKNFITAAGLKNSSTRLMPAETVLIALTGATCGLSALMKIEACANQSVTGILPSEKHSPDYLLHYLRTQRERILDKAWGNAQPHISQKFVKDLLIPLPPLPDQLYIANLLSKAENLICQRKESVSLLDEFLKSTFWEMFGNNTTDDKEWNKISLVDGCENKKDVKCGPFGTQLSKSEYQENGIPVWGIPQINSEFKILPKEYVTEQKALELDEYSVIPYDIVMSRKGNVGKCSLFPKGFSKGVIHSDVLRIRTDPQKILPIFLLFQLKYSKKIEMQIKSVTKGAIMAGINVGLLKHIIIDQPPLELQTRFGQIVEKAEALKAQYKQSLQELEHLYGCFTQRAFKGELILK